VAGDTSSMAGSAASVAGSASLGGASVRKAGRHTHDDLQTDSQHGTNSAGRRDQDRYSAGQKEARYRTGQSGAIASSRMNRHDRDDDDMITDCGAGESKCGHVHAPVRLTKLSKFSFVQPCRSVVQYTQYLVVASGDKVCGCMRGHIYNCVCVCMYIVCICIYIYIYIYIYTCVYKYIYMCIYIYMTKNLE
jgi:hypothetical protein